MSDSLKTLVTIIISSSLHKQKLVIKKKVMPLHVKGSEPIFFVTCYINTIDFFKVFL